MFTSFLKRERRYDKFKRKAFANREILPQQTRKFPCVPRSLSVSDNTTCSKRKANVYREITAAINKPDI